MAPTLTERRLAKQFQDAAQHGQTIEEMLEKRASKVAEFVRTWRLQTPVSVDLAALTNALNKLLETQQAPDGVRVFVTGSSITENLDCRFVLTGPVGPGCRFDATLLVMDKGKRWSFEGWSVTMEERP